MDLFTRISKLQLTRVSLALVSVVAISLAAGFSRPIEVGDEIMAQMGLQSGELVTIDQDQANKCEMAIRMDGKDYMIDYTFQSNRSKRFRLMVQQANGEVVEQDAPAASTIRGHLRGIEGSRVIGCITEDGCCAKIKMPSGDSSYIEPINRAIDNDAFAGIHVVYSKDDLIPEDLQCGCETNLIEAEQEFIEPLDLPATASVTAPTVLQECDLTVDADFEYFSIFGSTRATLARMELIINIINDQYESEAGIRHTISTAVVRETADDPYSETEANQLLNQLRNFYRANGINTDLCHLFTGKNLVGNTVGIAFTGVVCRNARYGLSQHVNQLSRMTDLVAHEMGHNWNLPHCSCPNHTMNASSYRRE